MGDLFTYNHEVKILMRASEVLESDGTLKESVGSEFKMKPKDLKGKKMSIQFVDTDNQVIYKSGWNLRLRKSEGKDDFELTYKKRFPIDISNNTDPKANIDAAVRAAHDAGFSPKDEFDAQVEVGYKSQTLSISHSEPVSDKGYSGMDLPQAEDSRNKLAKQAPENFQTWSISARGSDTVSPLSKAIVYGPVHAVRYKGKWTGTDVDIEVWPIRKSKTDATLENIVEISFKMDDTKDALEARGKLADLVKKKGWLVEDDSLKTRLIMERYGKV